MSERLARSKLLILVWPLRERRPRCRLCSFAGTWVPQHFGCRFCGLCARDFSVAFPGHFVGFLPVVAPESGSAVEYIILTEGTEEERVIVVVGSPEF